jgi:type I restriction enzyme M protein
MPRKQRKKSEDASVEAHEPDIEVPDTASSDGDMEEGTVREGFLLDFVTGADLLADTSKEQVRQRISRALFHEYGFSVEDMERDFSVAVGGKRRRADLAIFKPGHQSTWPRWPS